MSDCFASSCDSPTPAVQGEARIITLEKRFEDAKGGGR